MMAHPNISIIVPVFNVEHSLVRCLDSLCHQSFPGTFEVIAVDDGSTDGSLQLLDAYARHERRLTVIRHDGNKKLSIARSTGMKASSGDYIMHVDSDDLLLPGALDHVFRALRDTGADVVVFNYVRELTDGKRIYSRRIGKEATTRERLDVQRHFYGTCVNKAVKRSLIENMVYGSSAMNNGEDLLYATEVLMRARVIHLIPDFFYVYYENTASITRVITPQMRLSNLIVMMEQVTKTLALHDPPPEIRRNVFNYVMKLIFEALAVNAFIDEGTIGEREGLITALSTFHPLTQRRSRSVAAAFDHKYYCILQVLFRSGFRWAAGLIKYYLFARPARTAGEGGAAVEPLA